MAVVCISKQGSGCTGISIDIIYICLEKTASGYYTIILLFPSSLAKHIEHLQQ